MVLCTDCCSAYNSVNLPGFGPPGNVEKGTIKHEKTRAGELEPERLPSEMQGALYSTQRLCQALSPTQRARLDLGSALRQATRHLSDTKLLDQHIVHVHQSAPPTS